MSLFKPRVDRTAKRDLACGLFFSAIAVGGLVDIGTNDRLIETLGRGPDPGPALLPLVVLGVILLGGSLILLKGMLGWARQPHSLDMQPTARESDSLSQHAHAAALLVSLVLLPGLAVTLGFMAATWLFAAPWLAWLEVRRGQHRGRALMVGTLTAAVLACALHLIFITLLGVAL